MPAFITHYLFSKECKQLINNLADFKVDDDIVALGSQGPDIFFFTNPFSIKPMRKIGSALHRAKPEDIFNALASYIRQTNNSIAKSYAYGFILHYALDRKCHPYVYAFEKKITSQNKFIHHSSAHNRIEMGLDGYMLYKKCGTECTRDFCTDTLFELDEKNLAEVGKTVSYLVNRITAYKLTPKKAISAIRSTRRMQKLLRDRTGILTVLCKIIECMLSPIIKYFKFSSMIRTNCWKKGIKYANINNEEWISPFDTEYKSTKSFEQLFELATKDAEGLLFGFMQIIQGKSDGKEITNNISFLTGKEVY